MPETYPLSPSGVAFEELEGSPRMRISEDGISAVRRFRIPIFSAWPLFVGDLVGLYSMSLGGVSVPSWQPGAVVAYAPTQMAFPAFPNCLVADVEVMPFQPESPDSRPGGDPDAISLPTQTNTYDDNEGGALVIAKYDSSYDVQSGDRQGLGQSATLEPPPGTYMIYEQDISGEVLTIPGRTFYWQGTLPQEKLSADLNPGIIIPSKTYTLTWTRCIAPPWTTMDAQIGTVNQSYFLGAPPGTVMFIGCQAKRIPWFQLSGTLWKLKYRFAQQSKFLSNGTAVGWNYLYKNSREGGEHWVQILSSDGNNAPHNASNFYNLFVYGN